VGRSGCQNVALFIELAAGMGLYDFSSGANSAVGTVGPLTRDTLIVLFLRADTGAFVNLLTIGNYYAPSISSLDDIAKGVMGPSPGCEVVVNAIVTDFPQNTCLYRNSTYKLLFTTDNSGNLVASSIPSCSAPGSSSASPRSRSPSTSPVGSKSPSSTPTKIDVTTTATITPSAIATPATTTTPSVASITPLKTPAPTTTPKSSSNTVAPVPSSQFDPQNAELTESTTTIKKSTNKNGFEINLVGTGKNGNNYSYGSVQIPPKLVPVGWTVSIYRVSKTDLKKPKPSSKDGCGDKKKKKESSSDVVSIAFNLIIKDQHGKERSLAELMKKTNNKDGIEIELVYGLKSSQQKSDNKLRFGYLQDGESAWKYLENSDYISANKGFGKAKATTKHLTSEFIQLVLTSPR